MKSQEEIACAKEVVSRKSLRSPNLDDDQANYSDISGATECGKSMPQIKKVF